MTKTLLVAEKPKVAKRIADALGDYTVEKNHQVKNYRIDTDRGKLVIAPAVGHLFSLEQKSDEWDYPKFDVEWVPTPQKNDSADYMKKYLKNLREQGKDAELFINGCDFDIEGSTIGFNAIKYACNGGKDQIKRMKFSTLTSSDLKKAFDNLNEFDRGQTEAGLTRHVLDWYYGINLSRALMKAVKKNNRYKSLSTGRVQGPALKILAEKERKIQEFEPEDYWEVYLHSKDLEAKHEADKIWEEAKADAILKKCKDSQAKVANIKRNRYKHNPPSPFNLTGLQKEASSQFNIKPKKTQQLAQNLYESSLISYPRTESQRLPKKIGYKNILNKLKKQDNYEEKAEKVLKKKKLKPNQGKKKDKAHPAIHPTGLKPKKLGKKEKKIYDLIVKRFFAVFGKPAKRESVKTTLDIQGEKFNAKAKRTLERNWFNLYDPYVKVKEQEVPELKEGETVKVEKLEKEEKQTKPPKRYKQSSLVSELEKKDLGTKCLTEDQKIIVEDKNGVRKQEISDLFSGIDEEKEEAEICFNKKDKKIVGFKQNFHLSEFKGISRRKVKEDEKILKIRLEDQSILTVTENHPVLTCNNNQLQYRSSSELEPGDKLVRAHRGKLKTTDEVTFQEFIKNLTQESSLYGDINLKKFRKKKELSQKELSNTLETSQGVVSSVENQGRGLLRYWKNIESDPPNKISSENFGLTIENPFPLKITPALLRIIGMLQGDGSFDSEGKEKENKVDFRYHNSEKELLRQFQRDINSLFNYKPEIKISCSERENTVYYIRLPAVIGRIILEITENLSREWIISQKHREHYVGALIADEGHVSPSEPKAFISNTDKKILKNCQEILSDKGIESKINKNQKKLYIRGKRNLERLLEKVPLYTTRKHQALIDLLERHYKYGEKKSSITKQKEILKALQYRPLHMKELTEKLGTNPGETKNQVMNLRKKGYVKKVIEGKTERPRKEIKYKAQKPISDTFYSEIGEKAVGEAHTQTVEKVEDESYEGYVYDILDAEESNFLLSNRIVVHNSTRAQIVESLYDRKYIKNSSIEVTDLGMAVVEALEKHAPEILSEKLTRQFEEDMEKIKAEEKDREEVIEEAEKTLTEILQKFKEEEKEVGKELIDAIDQTKKRERQLGPCNKCEDGTLRIVKTKGSRFVGCSNYPDCENTYPLPKNGKIESMDKTCKECGKPMIKVIRKGKKPYTMCIDPECPSKDDW